MSYSRWMEGEFREPSNSRQADSFVSPCEGLGVGSTAKIFGTSAPHRHPKVSQFQNAFHIRKHHHHFFLSLRICLYADVFTIRQVTSRAFTPGWIYLLRFIKSLLPRHGFPGNNISREMIYVHQAFLLLSHCPSQRLYWLINLNSTITPCVGRCRRALSINQELRLMRAAT